jgi:hypothetical protein
VPQKPREKAAILSFHFFEHGRITIRLAAPVDKTDKLKRKRYGKGRNTCGGNFYDKEIHNGINHRVQRAQKQSVSVSEGLHYHNGNRNVKGQDLEDRFAVYDRKGCDENKGYRYKHKLVKGQIK